MIARLKGIVDVLYEQSLIIDVNGVGYKVFASSKTLQQCIIGDSVVLDIETVVREDAFNLYGFLNANDKQWFEILTSVQGVGAKVALAIQSILAVDDLYTAVSASDKTAFGRANGVGPKLAGRIVLELKDKVAKMDMWKSNVIAFDDSVKGRGSEKIQENGQIMQDALSALVNLGFNRSLAFSAIGKAIIMTDSNSNSIVSIDTIIPIALKQLNAVETN